MIKLKPLLKEATYDNSRIIKIANSTNKSEIKNIINVLLHADWTAKEIGDAVKQRKAIDAKSIAKIAAAKAKAASISDREKSKHWDDRHFSKPKRWTPSTYKKWIKDVSSNGGKRHSFDMAQNANNEHGLIDYVKKQIKRNYGDESPLERIQWDIEAS